MHDKKKQSLTPKEAKLKAANYCAYQERSQQEVRNKLYEYGLHPSEVEDILCELIVDGFVNEERFARQYAGGKFRLKKWGRKKIMQGLAQHKLSKYCVQAGLSEIDEDEYRITLEGLIRKKAATMQSHDAFLRKNKVAVALIAKGYEPELVWEVIGELPDQFSGD